MLRPVRFLAAALVLAVLAGCGDRGPTPEQQVRTTVSEFGRATAAKDYKALCDGILAPKLVEDVTSVGLSCEAALKRGLGNGQGPAAHDRQRADRRRQRHGRDPDLGVG